MKQGKKKHWFWRSFLVTACLIAMAAGLFAADYNTRILSDGNGSWLADAYGQQQEYQTKRQTALSKFYRSLLPEGFPEATAFLPSTVQLFLWGEQESSRLMRTAWEKIIKK